MQQLTSVNPTIRWAKCEVDFIGNGETITIKGPARGSNLPTVQLCSAKVSLKAICKGKQAWFMMLHETNTISLHGVEDIQGNREVVHDQPKHSALASKWKVLLYKYANVFEQSGKPVARGIDHRIDLAYSEAVHP